MQFKMSCGGHGDVVAFENRPEKLPGFLLKIYFKN